MKKSTQPITFFGTSALSVDRVLSPVDESPVSPVELVLVLLEALKIPPHDQSAKGSHDLLCPQCQLGQLNSRHYTRICELCGYVESCENVFPRVSAGSDSEQQRVKLGGPSVAVKARVGGMAKAIPASQPSLVRGRDPCRRQRPPLLRSPQTVHLGLHYYGPI